MNETRLLLTTLPHAKRAECDRLTWPRGSFVDELTFTTYHFRGELSLFGGGKGEIFSSRMMAV